MPQNVLFAPVFAIFCLKIGAPKQLRKKAFIEKSAVFVVNISKIVNIPLIYGTKSKLVLYSLYTLKGKAMNHFFTSSSTSFLLIMLIIFGVSALIKFAIRLFEMLVKLALILIVIFFGFKALESDNVPPTNEYEPNRTPLIDTTQTDTSLVVQGIFN